MPHINPTWQLAVATAGVLLLATLLLRWRGWPRTAAAAREITLVSSLYAAWQLIGTLTHRNVDGAVANALTVWHAQQALHLPSELALQQAMIPHPWLVQVANAYYVYGHFNPVIALLGWVWWRHRDAYPRTRLLLCLLTAAAFVVHFIPVAPPRLTPGLGFHDVALEYGQSVYGSFGEGIPGQLLAMPSLHVGWSVLLAYVVVLTARSRWRWLVVAHPVLMTLDVAATANHWWADGFVSCVLLALCVAAERGVRALRVPTLEPVPAPTLST
ncbi:MAG: phosphatase PAP2 family protein [Actinobacteria bacterium]|nr:phosphatase PAP2 family protein [Actinomycetota bacterium]MCA1722366.1 phosphatase PAP2 family protein [Actinomycetota bacterium]